MVIYCKMWQLVLLVATAWSCSAVDLPPSCSRPVYCDSDLLHHVQLARIFEDSKTFVDLEMNFDQNKTLADFNVLLEKTNGTPSKEQIQKFVDEYFSKESELQDWQPSDYNENPTFINIIRDAKLRQFAKQINDIWPILARTVKSEVRDKPEQFSLIPVSNGFIIPGGRFKELYYWDTFWIIEGLLISGMHATAKGMIENLIELLYIFGHIPNGSRWYYQERSQPPMLSAMMAIYFKYTNDDEFIKDNLPALERELDYWMEKHSVTFEKDGKSYTLLRYYAPSRGPRPESYYEDYTEAQKLNENDRSDFYVDIKSAAESGWDFSTRWFISGDGNQSNNLTDIHTRVLLPVDLNSIFAGALQNAADFHLMLRNTRKAAQYADLANEWKTAIQAVLWDENDGVWYDYDFEDQKHRKIFYTSNFAPLWQGAVPENLVKINGPRVVSYLQDSKSLVFPGGIPTSLNNSGEQWDFPNVWPPEVSIVVNALEAVGTKESRELALEVAQTFVRSCHQGFDQYKQMFEKYDANKPGQYGGGGEYNVQFGFGWSNGAVLEFLHRYAEVITADDSETPSTVAPNNSFDGELHLHLTAFILLLLHSFKVLFTFT